MLDITMITVVKVAVHVHSFRYIWFKLLGIKQHLECQKKNYKLKTTMMTSNSTHNLEKRKKLKIVRKALRQKKRKRGR